MKQAQKKVPVTSKAGRLGTLKVAILRLISAFGTAFALIHIGHIFALFFTQRTIHPALWALVVTGIIIAGIGAGLEIAMGARQARLEEQRLRRALLFSLYQGSQMAVRDSGESQPAHVVNLMTDNVERATEFKQNYWGATLGALLIPFITALYITVRIDYVTGIGIFLGAILVPFCVRGFMQLFRTRSNKSRAQRAQLVAKYLDAIRNLVTIRLLGAGSRIERELRAEGEKNRVAIMKILAGNQIVILVLDGAVSLFLVVFTVVVTAWRVNTGHLAVMQALTVVLLIMLVLEPLAQVAGFFYIGMGGMAAQRAIGKYFTARQVTNDPEFITSSLQREKVEVPLLSTDPLLQVAGLNYKYDTVPVLTALNLDVAQGDKIAIVGVSGAGKSTLVSLLKGYLAPQDNSLFVGGHDVANLSAEQLRAVSASMAQNTWLFSGTIADNLRVARPAASDEELWSALAKANLDKDVQAMVNGLTTEVGERGSFLSGGQAQRLSLARALLSERKILLMDEPTSQVDLESERLIVEAIANIPNDITVIIVTHRQSLLKAVDRVYRLVEGKLVQVDE